VLSAQAYTFGKKARLAVSLAWVGGFVDAVGFIELHVYTSNMTGNTAMIGQRAADGAWGNVLYVYFLVTMFLLGAMLAGGLIETARRLHFKSVYSAALGLEALLLAVTVVYVDSGGGNLYLRGLLPCLAMGLQNATVTRISGSVVRTTHVTGIVTDLGLETVQFLFWLRDRHLRLKLIRQVLLRPVRVSPVAARATIRRIARFSQRHPTFQRLLLLGSIWMTFVTGAALGAWVWRYGGVSALLVPAVFLGAMIVLERLTPMASVDAVDRAARAKTFLAYGIEPDIVPETVGMYEVTGDTAPGRKVTGTPYARRGRGATRVRPPDLGELHVMVKAHERVVILVLAGDLELDDNALAGLETSLDVMRRTNRDLITCVSDPGSYRAITESGFGHRLGGANLCSDPEFAVARALDVLASGDTTKSLN
jgi:uncharacterized membrane protein YoaK (UPF0700 family)